MRKMFSMLVAAAAVIGFAVTAQAEGGCGGMYSASLDVATEQSTPMSTPADGATMATDTVTKPLVTEKSGG